MKITVLTPHLHNQWPNLGDIYIALGIAKLFERHDITWVPLQTRPTPETLKQIQATDLLVIGGSNILGVMNTVRIGWHKEDFLALDIPIIPLAMGAQAQLHEKVTIDKAGMELLDIIARKSGVISVRDQFTYEFLTPIYGADKVRLTGCTASFIGKGDIEGRTDNIVFCPGPLFPHVSPIKNLQYFQHFKYCLNELHMTHIVGHQQESVYFSRILGKPVIWHPNDYMLTLRNLVTAKQLITGRIHAAIAAIQCAVPTVVIATDERCVSIAQTYAIPYVTWSPHMSKQTFLEETRRTMQLYDQARVDLTLQNLRNTMQLFLKGYSIDATSALSAYASLPLDSCRESGNGLLVSYLIACSKNFHSLYPLLKRCYDMIPGRK